MASQPNNIELFRRALGKFNTGDMEEVRKVCAEGMVYRVAGRSPIAGTYLGADAFAGLLNRLKELTGGTVSLQPRTVVSSGDDLMMVAYATAERADGRKLEQEQIYHYQFEDGRLAGGRTVPTDIYAFDEFWA